MHESSLKQHQARPASTPCNYRTTRWRTAGDFLVLLKVDETQPYAGGQGFLVGCFQPVEHTQIIDNQTMRL